VIHPVHSKRERCRHTDSYRIYEPYPFATFILRSRKERKINNY